MSYIITRHNGEKRGILLDDGRYPIYFGRDFYQGDRPDLEWTDNPDPNRHGPKLPKQYLKAYEAADELRKYLKQLVIKGDKEKANCCKYSIEEYL